MYLIAVSKKQLRYYLPFVIFPSTLTFKECDCGQKLKRDLSGLASRSDWGFLLAFHATFPSSSIEGTVCCVLVAVHYGFRGELLPHLRVSKHICHIMHIVHETMCMYIIQREWSSKNSHSFKPDFKTMTSSCKQTDSSWHSVMIWINENLHKPEFDRFVDLKNKISFPFNRVNTQYAVDSAQTL